MFITGPDVIKTVTGEEVTFEELGGAMTHNTKSGVAHFATEDEDHCLEDARYLLSFLPQNNLESARLQLDDDPRGWTRSSTRSCPTPEQALRHARRDPPVLDDGEFLESTSTMRRTSSSDSRASPASRSASSPISRRRSRACSTSTPRPRRRGSCASATRSTSRSSPSSTCPASCPAPTQEYGGIIRHGAKLLYAFAEATVPKITVITRKAYGGAYDVMASKHIRADFNFAWPTAEIAVMGPEGAVNIVFRREIAARPTPEELRAQLIEDYSAIREPVRRRRTRIHRRRDRARTRPARADHGSAPARHQARAGPAAQARQHPALDGRSRAPGAVR